MLVDFGNCKTIKRRKGSISSMEHIRSIFKMGKRIFILGVPKLVPNNVWCDKKFQTQKVSHKANYQRLEQHFFVCVKSDFTNFFADILDILSFFPIGQWLHSSRRSGGDQQMELVQWCDHFFLCPKFFEHTCHFFQKVWTSAQKSRDIYNKLVVSEMWYRK